MWFGLILACSIEDPADCRTLVSNIVQSEEACEATAGDGYDYVTTQLPGYQVVAFRCDTWGEPA